MITALLDQSPNPASTPEAIEQLRTQIAARFNVAHDADGRTIHDVLSAYHNTTQSHTTSAAWEAVQFNSEDDLRGVSTIRVPLGVHSKTTRTDRFVVPGDRSGPSRYVRISARVFFASNGTGSRGLRIVLNDDQTRRRGDVFHPAAAIGATALTTHAWFSLAPGETFRVEAYQDSGGALTLGVTARETANEIEVEFL